MNDNQQENNQPETNPGFDDSSPVNSETISPPNGSESQQRSKKSASDNLKKTFGSGPGLIAAVIVGLALILFISLGIRGFNKTDDQSGVVQQPTPPDTNINQVVSPEEAERRRQYAAIEASNAANAGNSYQAPFDLNIQDAESGYSPDQAGQFNLNADAANMDASTRNQNEQQAQNQQAQQQATAEQQEQQRQEAAAAAAYQAQQQAYKDALAVRDEDILNRRTLLNNQVDSLYKNMLPNGRHTNSVYYNPSNEQNKGKPGSGNPNTQAPNNPVGQTSNTSASPVQRTPFIKAGSIMYAQLDAEIDTDDGGPVMATIYGGKLAGAKLLGQVEKGNDNIRLAFRTVSPNDANKGTFGIDAVALRTEDAKQGLATSINRHTISRYSSLIFSSALAGVGDAFANRQYGTVTQLGNGTTVIAQNDTVNDREIIGNAVGRVGQNLSGEIMQRGFNRATTYKVARGTGVAVYFMSDIYLDNQ